MKALIVSGGDVEVKHLREYLTSKKYDFYIAVDRGLEIFIELNLTPDYIIGDFDSLQSIELLEKYRENSKIIKLNPEKDLTDTHEAVSLAKELNIKYIELFGAIGTRLDHVLANLNMLKYSADREIELVIINEKSRIRILEGRISIDKKMQYGDYVSILPYTESIVVSLDGFKYNLSSFNITNDISIGISNEIVDSVASINIEKGIALIIEARD